MSPIPNIPNLLKFLGSLSQWDIPLYKRLTKTDLGLEDSNGKKSNQGGPLIPVEFIDYMPQFPEPTEPLASDSIDINLELWNEKFYWGQSRSKFLYETRNLQRPREYRITTNIKQWLSKAEADDFIIIQKSLITDKHLRIVTLSKESIDNIEEIKRFGILSHHNPLTIKDLNIVKHQREELQTQPFQKQDFQRGKVTSTSTTNARSKDFSEAVNVQYNYKCALCGEGLCSPAGSNNEVEAAHIIPVASNGPDDVRNGLTLCRKHHWAFDRGMWGLTDALTVTVPASVKALPQNDQLTAFDGKKIYQPKDMSLQPHIDAIRWHRDNILLDN